MVQTLQSTSINTLHIHNQFLVSYSHPSIPIFESPFVPDKSQVSEVLRQVEEVVQQGLPRHAAEMLEAIQDDDDGAVALEAFLRFRRHRNRWDPAMGGVA